MARNKYGAKRTKVGDVTFASKAEAKRDAELLLLERAGKIREIKRQPKFDLIVNGVKVCRYVADWRYQETVESKSPLNYATFVETVDVVEDRKGVQTAAFKIKWKLAQALYPEIEWRLT